MATQIRSAKYNEQIKTKIRHKIEQNTMKKWKQKYDEKKWNKNTKKLKQKYDEKNWNKKYQ